MKPSASVSSPLSPIMVHTVYISIINPEYDASSSRITEDFKLLTHEKSLKTIRIAKGYKISSQHYTLKSLKTFTNELLVDPITEQSSINKIDALLSLKGDFYAEVSFKPGITDNEATTLRAALKDKLEKNFDKNCQTASTIVYAFVLDKTANKPKIKHAIEQFLKKSLMNPLIEDFQLLTHNELIKQNGFSKPPHLTQSSSFTSSLTTPPNKTISFTTLNPTELEKLSKTHHLHLSLAELEAIQKYYLKKSTQTKRHQENLPTEPTQAELEAIAQTWSEHCKHKIFAADIEYRYGDGAPQLIHSLYKSYIKKLTHKLAKKRKDLLSVFHDNAGVFEFTKEWSIAMKVETHNTPAALDPFGGALTGIVGVNRDILGTGIGAKPLFNTNVFCFANPRNYETRQNQKKLPLNVHHPKRMMRGVHYGVERGGNESGIPTVNGAMVFDERFLGRPLVFCGTGGLLERKLQGHLGTSKLIRQGDYIVTAGGRVGKDGIHGATASSSALDSSAPTSIVQIGDAITQKKLTDFLMQAKQKQLYTTLTDNGAGGLSSSVGEMAQISGGADLNLDKIPLKYPALEPWEILISESQERMTLVVSPKKWNALKKLAQTYDTEIAHIGKFTTSGVFRVFYNKTPVAHLPLQFLHNGTPKLKLQAHFTPINSRKNKRSPTLKKADFEDTYIKPALLGLNRTSATSNTNDRLKKTFLPFLKQLLQQPNIASKESWVRRYDHEVKARTVVKPFDGADGHGINDAAVIRPLLSERKGLSISNGILPRYSAQDAYTMTAGVIDEAVRNLIAVGTDPRTLVGLDNFAWPDPLPSPNVPDSKEKLGQLVRSAEALYDVCLAYTIPLISGKDSMKNDTVLEFPKTASSHSPSTKRVSIPPTLLFTALGTLEDIDTAITAPFKSADSYIYLAGLTYPELGGSEYANLIETLCEKWRPPSTSPTQRKKTNSQPLQATKTFNLYEKLLTSFTVPKVRTAENLALYQMTHRAIGKGFIQSAHDLSDGGLLVALSECAFGGMIGAEIVLEAVPTSLTHYPIKTKEKNRTRSHYKETHLKPALRKHYHAILGTDAHLPLPTTLNFDNYAYSESHGRLLFEVKPKQAPALEKLFQKSKIPISLKRIGRTHSNPTLHILWKGQSLRAPLKTLRQVWQQALNF